MLSRSKFMFIGQISMSLLSKDINNNSKLFEIQRNSRNPVARQKMSIFPHSTLSCHLYHTIEFTDPDWIKSLNMCFILMAPTA